MPGRHWNLRRLAAVLGLLALTPAGAAVLPEDRADALFHGYKGGGVSVYGPSLLVRKSAGPQVSAWGNYYRDIVSSASIDVELTASEYRETRNEYGVGVDYLRGRTTMSLALSRSDESDYTANSGTIDISQEMFGDLTTVSLGYTQGEDRVGRNGDDTFEESITRRNFRVGISQILTSKLLMSLNYEAVTWEGFLNNPYRSVRFLDPAAETGFGLQAEVYPGTRTSNAASVRARYRLPWKAAVGLSYRYFTDTWEIDAHTAELDYSHQLGRWTADLRYRFYTQNEAEFYSDLFPREDAQNFLARDKELSRFQSHTLGFGLSYEFLRNGSGLLERGSLNLALDHIRFSYDNFRDAREASDPGVAVGEEPRYEFSANVFQAFVSVWF